MDLRIMINFELKFISGEIYDEFGKCQKWQIMFTQMSITTFDNNQQYFNNMKRGPTNTIEEFEEKSRKLVKSEVTPVNGAVSAEEKSELTYFIKDEKVLEVLREKGIKKFFPVQYETYQDIFDGKDLIAKDRTGSGKTMGFSLPIIQRFRESGILKQSAKPKFLIVLPTRELAIQVKNEIESLRLKGKEDFYVVPVYGGTDMGQQIRKIKQGADIIVSTPGRLLDLLEKGVINLSKLQVTCLDEADEMLKQGFQEDIERIFEYIEKNAPRKTQNLLFSATIPTWVVDLSRKYLSPDRKFVDLIKDSDIRTSKTVEHLALNCPYYHRNAVIADLVNLYGGRHGRTIIFCETKREVNEIMLKANIKQQSQPLHGDIPQKQRQVTFHSFKEGKLKVLIATNVAARGLDIPEVDLILQLEPPKEIDAYIHRAGRTGRAGKSGVCVTFYTRQQQPLLERIERLAKIKIKKIGAPQPADIVKASARDIVISLKEVNDGVLDYFQDIAEQMIKEEGAVKSLSKALAFISGNTKKIHQRSILCAMEGYITYMVKCPTQYQAPGFIFSFLRRNTSEELADAVKGMRRQNKTSAVFDVPEDFKPQMDEVMEECQKGTKHTVKGYEVIVVDSMAMLEEDEEAENGHSNGPVTELDERELRNAMKNKKEWEVFIGSLPPNADEREIEEFLRTKKVRIANVRVLRNDQGESKCVAFALCLDDESTKRALRLDGERFGSKSLRINRAAKR